MTSVVRRGFFAAVLCAGAMSAAAQVIVQPPFPTTTDNVTLFVDAPTFGYSVESVQMFGSTISIELRGAGSLLPVVEYHQIALGNLAAGTYTVVVTIVTDSGSGPIFVDTRPPFTFTVAQAVAVIPALDAMGFVALVAAMAVAAIVVLKR